MMKVKMGVCGWELFESDESKKNDEQSERVFPPPKLYGTFGCKSTIKMYQNFGFFFALIFYEFFIKSLGSPFMVGSGGLLYPHQLIFHSMKIVVSLSVWRVRLCFEISLGR
jgi:hypothetical protein